MKTLERVPALGVAESLAKYGFLANLFESFGIPQDRLRGLFAILIWSGTKEPQRGRDRAEVALGPFAETKGLRLPGRNPAFTENRLDKRDSWCSRHAILP